MNNSGRFSGRCNGQFCSRLCSQFLYFLVGGESFGVTQAKSAEFTDLQGKLLMSLSQNKVPSRNNKTSLIAKTHPCHNIFKLTSAGIIIIFCFFIQER